MPYSVFISHSSRDMGLVIDLANLLKRFGIKVYVAQWYLIPGEPLGKKVFKQIDNADCMVVLLTQNGIRSEWVHQEIGYAINSDKPLIPLVEKGVTNLGALNGKEYIKYDPANPIPALVRVSAYVKSLKLKKEEQEKALLVVGGILAFLLLLGGKR